MQGSGNLGVQGKHKLLRSGTNAWLVLSGAPQIFPDEDSSAKCQGQQSRHPVPGLRPSPTKLNQIQRLKKRESSPNPSDHNDYFHKGIQMFNFFFQKKILTKPKQK